jgi:hypothetical protein
MAPNGACACGRTSPRVQYYGKRCNLNTIILSHLPRFCCLRFSLSATMEKISNIPKRWILLWRSKSRPAVYQDRTYDDSQPCHYLLPRVAVTDWDAWCSSLEMQATLMTGSTTNEIETNTTDQPYRSQPKADPVRKPFRSRLVSLIDTRFAGWRFGVLHFGIWASVVFFINLIATIVGTTATKEGVDTLGEQHIAKGVLLEGDCDYIKTINTGLHLLINIFGTILLAGSNYSMQCLSAPTRNEIDSSHGLTPSVSLDIGIPGIRNLTKISRHRVGLWCLLGLSSLPLHLW